MLQIGKSNQSKGDADTVNVHRAADAWVHAPTNELFVADGYGNHRVIVFDADTGAFKRMWGAFGKPPGGEDSCAIVTPKTFPDAEGPAHFNVAHAIRVANDGMVYLADRENRRVQMFTSDGKFVKQLIRTETTFARNLALSADPAQQFLYVGGGKAISVVDRRSLDVVGSIQPPGILGSRPTRRATSISPRPPPGCRSWYSREWRRPNDAEVPQADVDDLEGFTRSRWPASPLRRGARSDRACVASCCTRDEG